MIINLVWSSGKRVYHESMRGNADKSSSNFVGKEAERRIDRLITNSKTYREAMLYIDAIPIGCKCSERRNMPDANCHPFHNDVVAMPPDALAREFDIAPLYRVDKSELDSITPELLAELHNIARKLFLDNARKRIGVI